MVLKACAARRTSVGPVSIRGGLLILLPSFSAALASVLRGRVARRAARSERKITAANKISRLNNRRGGVGKAPPDGNASTDTIVPSCKRVHTVKTVLCCG